MPNLDLQARIEESIGEGPAHRPIEERLRAGQRALLRRRIGTGLAALATVAVIGGGFALTQGGDDTRADDTSVASDPSQTQGTGEIDPDKTWNKPLVTYGPEGKLLLSDPDIEIVQQVDDPIRKAKVLASVGLEVELDGGRQWILLSRTAKGVDASYDPPRPNYPKFQDWLDDQVALAMDLTPKQYVTFGPEGDLVPAEGVTLLMEQQVDVGESFAPPGNAHLAHVRDAEGQEWFILARNIGGGPEFLPNKASAEIDTPAKFLTMAEQQYADGGEGLR